VDTDTICWPHPAPHMSVTAANLPWGGSDGFLPTPPHRPRHRGHRRVVMACAMSASFASRPRKGHAEMAALVIGTGTYLVALVAVVGLQLRRNG
jgi:hypothetical protein